MVYKANVPIVVGYIDYYKKKQMKFKSVIQNTSDMKRTITEISQMYKNVIAKYPKDLILDKRYSYFFIK